MRRSIPLRPRTETYPTPEPIAPKTTRKSSIQMLHSPHLAGFRLTDNGASNNIFTEDRSALKVKTNTNILTRSGPAPLEPSYINLLNKSKSREFAGLDYSSSEESSGCTPTIDDLMADIVTKDHALGFIDNFIGKNGHMADPISLLLRLTELYTAITRPNHRNKKMTASPGIVQFRVINLLKRLLDLVDEDEDWLRRLSEFVATLEAGDEVDRNRAQYFRHKIDEINTIQAKITSIRAAREMKSTLAPGKVDVGAQLSPKKSAARERHQAEEEDSYALSIEVPTTVHSRSKTEIRSTSPKKDHHHAKNKDQIKVERKIQKLQDKKINLRESTEKESSKENKISKLNKKLAQYEKKNVHQMRDQNPY
jgi:hypothetical protein